MVEIERKFLVKNNSFLTETTSENRITQGYINSNPERTVRIRIKGKMGYLTIKGKTNETGMSRLEWEKEITLEEANLLLPLCETGVIDKTRYNIASGNHIYEVDVFHGDNEGLIIAEIELTAENETFIKPEWLGDEVTNDNKYYNSCLSLNPFKNW